MPTSRGHTGQTGNASSSSSAPYYYTSTVPATTGSQSVASTSGTVAVRRCCCAVWRRMFHRYDFRRPETERLYAVYAYRSRFCDFRFLCGLLIVLFLSLAVVDFLYVFKPTIDSVSNVGLAAATSVLLVVVHTRLMTSSRLPVAGLILFVICLVFAASSLLPVSHPTPWSPAEGIWRLCYVTFIVYALMTSLRLYVAVMFGTIVAVAHGSLAIARTAGTHPGLFWRQIVVNYLLLIGVNIIGIYVYTRRDHSHRKLFGVIRACSSAGLRLHDERAKLERLLASLLTQQLVADMKRDSVCKHLPLAVCASRTNAPHTYDCVSILFADVSGLTALSLHCSAAELVRMLNELFGRFDQLATENHCLRVQLLGDCYYAVCGLPDARPDHAKCAVELGLDLVDVMNFLRESTESNISVRVGIHSGQVECGIVGLTRWKFDIWSSDVQLAEHMVHSGLPGRVHITEATMDHLHGEFDTEPGRGEQRSSFLRTHSLPTYLVVFDHPRKRYGPIKPTDSMLGGAVGGASRYSYGRHSVKSVSSLIARLVSSSVRFNADLPLANIFPQLNPVNNHSQQRGNNHACGRADTPLLGIDDESTPQTRLDKYMTAAVAGSASDKTKFSRMSRVTLCFKAYLAEYQYKNVEDSAFPSSMLSCLVLLALSVVVQAIMLPRTLLLLLLFLISFAWISVLLMLFLGYRIKCIKCDIRRSSGVRLLLSTVTILLASSVSLINVMCCRGGLIFPTESPIDSRSAVVAPVRVMHSVISFNRDLHLQCETPHYIYLCAVLSLLFVAAFVKMAAIAKLIFLLLICSGYLVVIEYIDRRIFIDFFQLTSLRSEVPPDIIGVCMLVHFVIALYICGRGDEWIQRLHFLWTQQSAEQQQELIELETENERLLLNILPRHVVPFFTAAKSHSQELYAKSYNKVIVCFASVITPSECDVVTKNMYPGQPRRQGLRMLRDVIAGFDELLEENRFVAVDKIKSLGNVYMFTVGLKPPYIIEETEDSMHRHLVIALQFVSCLRDRLSRIGDYFTLRVGMSIGPVVAGVVGARKPQYDVWGGCVNLARMLERTSRPLCIHVADDVYKPLRSRFQFQCRGPTKLKELATGSGGEVTTYFLYTEDRSQLPPLSPFTSRGQSNSAIPSLPCVVQCCSAASQHPRTQSNSELVSGSPMYSRLVRSSSSRDSQPMATPPVVMSQKISMTPPSSLGRHRRLPEPSLGSVGDQSRRAGSLSGPGSSNLVVPSSTDWSDRGRSPDLPLVHFCNANMLSGGQNGSNDVMASNQIQMLGMTGSPISSADYQLQQSNNVQATGRTGSASSSDGNGNQRTSSDPQLNRNSRPSLSRSNSQQQQATASTALPSIKESSKEIASHRNNQGRMTAAVSRSDGADPARLDIDLIMQELAESAERTSDETAMQRSNQSAQVASRYPPSPNTRDSRGQTSSAMVAPSHGVSTSTQMELHRLQSNSAPDPRNGAIQSRKNDKVLQTQAPDVKTSAVREAARPVNVEKTNGAPGSGRPIIVEPVVGTGRNPAATSSGLVMQLKMDRRRLDNSKVSPPPLPPPPNDEHQIGAKQASPGVQRPSLSSSPQRPSAFRPVQKSFNLIPTPSNAIYGVPLYRLYPLPGSVRGSAAAPQSGNQIYSQLNSRGAATAGDNQAEVQMRRRPQDSAGGTRPLGQAPSFRVRRSACVQSLPRLCRSMENIASDVDDCGPRSGSSSRPDSPDAGASSSRPRPLRNAAGVPLDRLLQAMMQSDDVSLSSFDGTGSEMSRSDPALSTYETFGGGSVGGFESEYDNYRPGMASDEDYFVPDPISDIDIDMFDDVDVDVENVTVRDTYPPPGGALPSLHKLISDV